MTSHLRALVVVVAMVIAACSSSDDDVATETTEAAEVTTSESAEVTTTEAADVGPLATKPDVVVPDGPTPTELFVDDLIEGDGPVVAEGDYLSMHYVGVRHSDGGQFDASWDRNMPFGFILGNGQVIRGWDQGIEGMKVGGRRLLSIPSELAYGDQERGAEIPANSALVFVVDLLVAASEPVVENAPEPVDELEVTVLEEGDGEELLAGAFVEFMFVAVTQPTGEIIDSSWAAGRSASVAIGTEPSQTIPAWNEGLVGLHVGDHVRMVIPPDKGLGSGAGGDVVGPDDTIITELIILGTTPQ